MLLVLDVGAFLAIEVLYYRRLIDAWDAVTRHNLPATGSDRQQGD